MPLAFARKASNGGCKPMRQLQVQNKNCTVLQHMYFPTDRCGTTSSFAIYVVGSLGYRETKVRGIRGKYNKRT